MHEPATETIAEHGLANVHLVKADAAASGLPRGSFDLAHTRLLLMNVPHPDAVVAELIALVRPGGMVALQDVDRMSRVCEPPHPAWDRLVAVIAELWRRNGMDVFLGRRAELCRAALLDAGLITATELDECLGALREHLNRPDTIVVHATLFQAWGRVPRGGGAVHPTEVGNHVR